MLPRIVEQRNVVCRSVLFHLRTDFPKTEVIITFLNEVEPFADELKILTKHVCEKCAVSSHIGMRQTMKQNWLLKPLQIS